MKLSKILLTTVAAAAVIGLTSCGSGDDDPNKMIKGSNSKYSIDYTNDSTIISRGYKDTYYKHVGAAVQFTFENRSAETAGSGVMGLIFDLEGSKKTTRSFDVVGVKTVNDTGALKYYISRFTGVKDIQDDNFGAYKAGEYGNEADGPATEIVYKEAFQDAEGKKDGDTVTVTAYAIQKKMKDAGNVTATIDGKEKQIAYKAGEWVYKVYLLNNEIKKLDKDGNLIDEGGKKVELEEKDCLAIIPTGCTEEEKPTQNKLAVYANVYPTIEALKEANPDITDKEIAEKATGCGTLTGTWTFHGDYYACDVEED